MNIPFTLIPGGKAPVKATAGAAAFDLCARVDPELVQSEGVGSHERPGKVVVPHASVRGVYNQPPVHSTVVKIPLGVAFAIPPGWVGKLYARSSMGSKGLVIPNGVGVIDSDYRGEVSALYLNLSGEDFVVRDGDRVAQIIFERLEVVALQPVESLDETARGAGGFGSTGVNVDADQLSRLGAHLEKEGK